MNVNRYFWVLSSAGLLLAAVVLYMLSTPVVSVTRQSCDAIRPGMALAEASTIIGGPPRWYDGIRSFGGGIPVDPKRYSATWVSSDGQIVLEMDDNSVVTKAAFAPILVCDQDSARLWTERLTRGMGEDVYFAALVVLLVVLAVVCWRKGLFVVGVGPVAVGGNAARSGLWLGIGNWVIALCTWQRASSVGNRA